MVKYLALLLILFAFVFACRFSPNTATEETNDTLSTISPADAAKAVLATTLEQQKNNAQPFDRTRILENLAQKRKDNKPLVIHIFVPLCDNKYQGIVPVPVAIGNGQDPKNNLYWGAKYGVKNHFKQSPKWKMIDVQQNLNEYILERVVFKTSTPQNQTVYMVADAYDGRQMKQCLTDYYAALAGQKIASITSSKDAISIPIYGQSDLLIFNGHNGLMDVDIAIPQKINTAQKDAVVIACVSGNYFQPAFLELGAYPLVMTTNLLAPEAYVLEGIIDTWMKVQHEEEDIRMAAAKAYNQYQKCGLRGASRLFTTGWQ